jgi:hypothetical protein
MSTARRSFDDVSPILSVSQTKKRKMRECEVLKDTKMTETTTERPLLQTEAKKMQRRPLITETDKQQIMVKTTYAVNIRRCTKLANAG